MKPERTMPAPYGRRAGPAHGYRGRLGRAFLPPARWRAMRRFVWTDVPAPAADFARDLAGELLCCPFCGRAPAWEHHPDIHEIVRLACGDGACAIQPRTEYLLVEYAGTLRDAWNGRAR